ncbi:MAG: hypothetical protein ACI4SM_03400 [Candidatus Gastranaerophilaceae bacterium]
MSRLSEILGVKEGQEFRFDGKFKGTYRLLKDDYLQYEKPNGAWKHIDSPSYLIEMINNSELIHPIPFKYNLSKKQITAIKGRIAEGTPWAVRQIGEDEILFFTDKPCHEDNYAISLNTSLYDFITFENSPVYLPELVEGK